MTPKLFLYALVWHPTDKQTKDDGAKSKVIKEITHLLANDDNTAFKMAAMQIPTEYKDQPEQVQIIIRPF